VRVLFVGRDVSHASTRVRWLQYEQPLAARGVEVRRLEWVPQTTADVARLTTRLLRDARWSDVVVLLKPRLHPVIVEMLRRVNPRLVVDIDDAVWTWGPVFGERFDRSARVARAISTGSQFLADATSRRYPDTIVERIPTAVDTEHYRVRDASSAARPVVVGWIGNTASLSDFSDEIIGALAKLRADGAARLRVVSSRALDRPELVSEFEPWSLDTEIDSLRRFDIGIMPLYDDEQARGRCGLKAIQCMAVGIPVVASPVGAAEEIITDGVDGFFASSEQGWYGAISDLAASDEQRKAVGACARRRVEDEFSVAANVPRLHALLQRVADGE
jgi:glycosyltransferase involved in cell wall biosynthesis